MQVIENEYRGKIKSVFDIGYQKAAESFASITSHRVGMKNLIIENADSVEALVAQYPLHKDLTVVQTDLIGEVKGESYLIFTPYEQEVVAQKSLKNFGGVDIDADTVCKEIDNILSAAVITELSNALNISVYGGVPHLFNIGRLTELSDKIGSDKDKWCFLVKSQFVFDGVDAINPIFFWMLDKKFISFLTT